MGKRQIKTCNKISERGLCLFPQEVYRVSDETDSPSAIILRSKKLTTNDLTPGLIAIGRAGAGTDNIPVKECTKKGVVVFNAPGANANAVNELTIASLLMAVRNLAPAVKALDGLPRSSSLESDAEKIKKYYAGSEVRGKILGVAGLGNIGMLVAQTAAALGMKIIGWDPMLSSEKKRGLPTYIEYVENLAGLGECNFVSFHVSLNGDTRGMINEKLINKFKPGVFILNFSRGGLVNTEDLASALDTEKVGVYITDFANPGLVDLPNVLTFPHLGASTTEAEDNCAQMACEQVKNFLEKGDIVNSVNFPDLVLEASTHRRVFVVYEDKPGMIGKIHDVFGRHGINIVRSTNGNRSNVCGAALLDIDFDGDLTPCTKELTRMRLDAKGIVAYRLIK